MSDNRFITPTRVPRGDCPATPGDCPATPVVVRRIQLGDRSPDLDDNASYSEEPGLNQPDSDEPADNTPAGLAERWGRLLTDKQAEADELHRRGS